ncbi:MAG: Fur family zinc uptake transcriptional regulator [Lentisphaeria bacterium]|jgi:Fur family zinc uptake transcriptional regulator
MTQQAKVEDHDHSVCINTALKNAQQICAIRGAKLTELRRQILTLVWQSHRPLGAYVLMDMLEQHSSRKRVAPPTVYRSLDFLMKHGLIYKVHSLNAYVGCSDPSRKRFNALFICTECGDAREVPSSTIQQAINLSASQHKFSVKEQRLEIVGLCHRCKLTRANEENLNGN